MSMSCDDIAPTIRVRSLTDIHLGDKLTELERWLLGRPAGQRVYRDWGKSTLPLSGQKATQSKPHDVSNYWRVTKYFHLEEVNGFVVEISGSYPEEPWWTAKWR